MTKFVTFAVWMIALLGIMSFAPRPVVAQEAPVRIVLEITDDGYRCVEGCDALDYTNGPWEPVIDVPLGTLVELHFIWAHNPEVRPSEEHIMRLEGYNLSTRELDQHNREATLRFIADQPGSFTLKCDLDCDLHDLMQRARVRVVHAGGTAAAVAYTPTTLALHVPVSELRGFDTVPIDLTLAEAGGEPLERAELRLYLETEFGGVRDLVHVGTVRTDERGAATYSLNPLTSDPEQRLVVRFAGMGVYAGSEAEVRIPLTSEPTFRYAPEQTRFEQVAGQFGRITLAFVILAIWSTFAFVLFQVFRIARDRTET